MFRRAVDNLTPEERDARTVFCMQLAARIRPRDLEDFFSAVGKVPFIFYCVLSPSRMKQLLCPSVLTMLSYKMLLMKSFHPPVETLL